MKQNVFQYMKISNKRVVVPNLHAVIVWVIALFLFAAANSMFRNDAFSSKVFPFGISVVIAAEIAIIADIFLVLDSKEGLDFLLPVEPKVKARYYYQMIWLRLLFCLGVMVAILLIADVFFLSPEKHQILVDKVFSPDALIWLLLNIIGVLSLIPLLFVKSKLSWQLLTVFVGQVLYAALNIGVLTVLMGGKFTAFYDVLGKKPMVLSGTGVWIVVGILSVLSVVLAVLWYHFLVKRVEKHYQCKEEWQ